MKLTGIPRFPNMFENVGLRTSAAVCAVLIIGVSIIPTVFLQFRPQVLRGGKE